MSDKATDFIKDNWFHLLSIVVAAIFGYAHLSNVAARVEILEKQGAAPIRERLQAAEQRELFTESRLAIVESDAKQTAQLITEFRSDLRLVVEWVKDQKRKDRSAP